MQSNNQPDSSSMSNNTPDSLNNNTQHDNTTTDQSSTSIAKEIKLMPIVLTQSNDLNPDLYPLVNLETPRSLKKFTFMSNGKPSLFEEVQGNSGRKRAASWDDERLCKRKELDKEDNNIAFSDTVNTFSTDIDIIPDSPNSALPSPISDMEPWSPTAMNEQEPKESTISNQVHHSLVDNFETLPDNIQAYFLFQLLKRSSRSILRTASDTILQALKSDILVNLPSPIGHQILSHLDIRSLCRATAVSKSWNQIIDNASDVWRLKMTESDFVPTSTETLDYKQIVRRHTIMQRNWRQNNHQTILLEGHEEDLVTCLQFDDEKIITGSDDHSINVYDINTGELQRILHGHDGGVWALQYVGNTLVTGSIDRTLRVWNIETGKCQFILRGHSSTIRCLKIIMPSEITKADGSKAIEPKEPIIVSGSRDTTLRVWKLPDINSESQARLSNCVEHDAVSRHFLKFKLAEHDQSVRDLAVYGNILVSGSYDNTVIVWNLETGKKVHTLEGHTMKVYCVTIDSKRRHCISGSLDASIRIWGLDDGECKFVLQGHAILVGLLGLTDDILVSAAADATLRIWDPSSGERLRILGGEDGHQAPITSYQHDKYKIVSGSDGGVKVWDTQTGDFLYDLIEDVAGVWRVCFDERRCIAAVKNEHRTQLMVLDFGIHGLEEDGS